MAVQGYRRRFTGPRDGRLEIWFRDREWIALIDATQVPPTVRARLEALMQHYCDHGPIDMNETNFKFLEHFRSRRRQIRLEEFKAKHVRLFGSAFGHDGRTRFFVTGIDVAKKQRKANRALLDAAGAEAIRISEILE